MNADGKMVGQVLERLNGVSCSKVHCHGTRQPRLPEKEAVLCANTAHKTRGHLLSTCSSCLDEPERVSRLITTDPPLQVLKDSKFADARYLRQMLLEVFTALDMAQRKFGFHRAHSRL